MNPGATAEPATSASAPTRRVPIEHIIVVFQENHTYDSLFAESRGGLGDTSIPVDTDPPSVAYKTTPTHGNWWSMRYPKLNGYRARLTRAHVPLLHEWGDAYALCDTYHTEKNGPSDWNHVSTAIANTNVVGKNGKLQAWIDNPQYWSILQKLGRFFRDDPDVVPPITPEVVQTSLENAGYSWGVYGDSPFTNIGTVLPSGTPLNKSPQLRTSDDFATDARAGNLPTVSWVAAQGTKTGGPPGPAGDGMMWLADQLQAVVDGGLWEKTAVFITWDDSGGYWDHVEAPAIEPMPQDRWRPQRLGKRVPCLVISPYARAGYRSSESGGMKSHRSLLKFTNEYLGLPSLDKQRDAEVDSMWDCFDFDQQPLAPPVTKLTTPLPKISWLQRIGIEARRIPAKFEANMLLQEVATMYLLDRTFGPDHGLVRYTKRFLGIENPRVGHFGHQGVPRTPFGWLAYGPLALAGVVPGILVDIAFMILIKMGIQGIPSPRATSRERRYNRALTANKAAGIEPRAHDVSSDTWAQRQEQRSATVGYPEGMSPLPTAATTAPEPVAPRATPTTPAAQTRRTATPVAPRRVASVDGQGPRSL